MQMFEYSSVDCYYKPAVSDVTELSFLNLDIFMFNHQNFTDKIIVNISTLEVTFS